MLENELKKQKMSTNLRLSEYVQRIPGNEKDRYFLSSKQTHWYFMKCEDGNNIIYFQISLGHCYNLQRQVSSLMSFWVIIEHCQCIFFLNMKTGSRLIETWMIPWCVSRHSVFMGRKNALEGWVLFSSVVLQLYSTDSWYTILGPGKHIDQWSS